VSRTPATLLAVGGATAFAAVYLEVSLMSSLLSTRRAAPRSWQR